jgi:hypothetical protein
VAEPVSAGEAYPVEDNPLIDLPGMLAKNLVLEHYCCKIRSLYCAFLSAAYLEELLSIHFSQKKVLGKPLQM